MSMLERLDEQFPWENSYIQQDLRSLMAILEVRFQSIESFTPSWEDEVSTLTAVGLSRVNEILGPLLERVNAASQLGFLVAYADNQDNNLVEGEPFALLITSEGREFFTPTPWLSIMDRDDETNWGHASLQSYDSSTGELTMTVSYASTGVTGTNWVIACGSGILPKVAEASEAVVQAKNDVETLAGQFATDLATLQDLLVALQESSSVISVTINGASPAQSGVVDLTVNVSTVSGLQAALDAKATTTYVNTQLTSKQASSAKLSAISDLEWAADYLAIFTGVSSLQKYSISPFTRDTLLSKTTDAEWRTALGVVDVTFASDAEIRSSTSAKAISSASLASASEFVNLTDATTIALDWNVGINRQVTLAANRTLGNPTNGKPGQTRIVLVKGDSATARSLVFGNQYLGALPSIVDASSTVWYLLSIFCITSSHFTVSSKRVLG